MQPEEIAKYVSDFRPNAPAHGGLTGGRVGPLTGALTGPEPTINEARAILKQANEIACRIVNLSDRLCGFSPAPEGQNANAVPDGVLNQFRAEMRDTRQAMIFADDALTRIEQELIG